MLRKLYPTNLLKLRMMESWWHPEAWKNLFKIICTAKQPNGVRVVVNSSGVRIRGGQYLSGEAASQLLEEILIEQENAHKSFQEITSEKN